MLNRIQSNRVANFFKKGANVDESVDVIATQGNNAPSLNEWSKEHFNRPFIQTALLAVMTGVVTITTLSSALANVNEPNGIDMALMEAANQVGIEKELDVDKDINPFFTESEIQELESRSNFEGYHINVINFNDGLPTAPHIDDQT